MGIASNKKKKKGLKKKKKKVITKRERLFNGLTNLRFDLNGETYELSLGEELLIGAEDLHTQVERIPAVLGYIGSIVANLEKEYEDKKILRKKIEATLDKEIRITGTTGEIRIEKAIQRQPDWLEASLAVNIARENWTRAKNLAFSIKAKHSSLVTRSADIRTNPSDSILGVSARDILPEFIDEDDNLLDIDEEQSDDDYI